MINLYALKDNLRLGCVLIVRMVFCGEKNVTFAFIELFPIKKQLQPLREYAALKELLLWTCSLSALEREERIISMSAWET